MIHHKTAENTSTNNSDSQQLLSSLGPSTENVNEETQHNEQNANNNHPNNILEGPPTSQ